MAGLGVAGASSGWRVSVTLMAKAQDPLPQAASQALQPPPAAAAAQAAEEEDKEDHLKRKENVYCILNSIFGVVANKK